MWWLSHVHRLPQWYVNSLLTTHRCRAELHSHDGRLTSPLALICVPSVVNEVIVLCRVLCVCVWVIARSPLLREWRTINHRSTNVIDDYKLSKSTTTKILTITLLQDTLQNPLRNDFFVFCCFFNFLWWFLWKFWMYLRSASLKNLLEEKECCLPCTEMCPRSCLLLRIVCSFQSWLWKFIWFTLFESFRKKIKIVPPKGTFVKYYTQLSDGALERSRHLFFQNLIKILYCNYYLFWQLSYAFWTIISFSWWFGRPPYQVERARHWKGRFLTL